MSQRIAFHLSAITDGKIKDRNKHFGIHGSEETDKSIKNNKGLSFGYHNDFLF